MRLSQRHKLAGILAVTVVPVGLAAWLWSQAGDAPDYGTGPDETDYGPRPDAPSTDLAADLKRMWETRDGASTPAATRAAERVFATVELVGLTRAQVIARLGDPRTSSASRYNFPFYPAGRGDLVYRFDTGAWGCQYNVQFGRDGKVGRVRYLMIE